MNMEGLTMPEMATILGIDEAAVKMRLWKAGIKPLTTKAVYPASALDVIRDVPIRGQHRKKPTEEMPVESLAQAAELAEPSQE